MYFGDDDVIYDIIIQEPVWKWSHNYRHEISRDPFAESVLFQTHSLQTQSFSFLEQLTGPNLPFMVLALCTCRLLIRSGRSYNQVTPDRTPWCATIAYFHLQIACLIYTCLSKWSLYPDKSKLGSRGHKSTAHEYNFVTRTTFTTNTKQNI